MEAVCLHYFFVINRNGSDSNKYKFAFTKKQKHEVVC